MEKSDNQFLVKNKTIQGQVKVDDKISVAKSEDDTTKARSEQIKDSSTNSKDGKFTNEANNSARNSARNVRAREVARVKNKIKNGYNVDSRDIAESILKNLLQNS